MKVFLLLACVLGTAFCAPQNYMEFDFHYAPAQAVQAVPAGVPIRNLELILPVDAQGRPIAGATSGFVKQKIYQGPGKESLEILHPFGFAPPAPAVPAAPAVVVPAAPAVVPAAPVVVPAAPAVIQVVVAPPPARKRKTDDDDDEEEARKRKTDDDDDDEE